MSEHRYYPLAVLVMIFLALAVVGHFDYQDAKRAERERSVYVCETTTTGTCP